MGIQEFITRNKLALRSQRDIAERCANPTDNMFGWDAEAIITALDFDHAKPFLKDGVTADQWTGAYDLESVAAEFLSYVDFAWEKANGERGISASRSITKLAAWMWALGRDDVASVLENESLYAPYGKPALRAACLMLGLPDQSA